MPGIMNLEKVHPLKREKVKKGLMFVHSINAGAHVIDRIAVFGSSVRGDCTEKSDIDLCIFSGKDCRDPAYRRIREGLADAAGDSCDILKYRLLSSTWKELVDREGVIVYG